LSVQHPSEIELSGGLGEPMVVACLPEHCQAAHSGLCEGYELVWYEWWDAVKKRWCKEDSFCKKKPGEILAQDSIKLPVKLFFRSPLTRLPNLSERQLSEQLGLRRVKELHFRRLVSELEYTWSFLLVQSVSDLLKIQAVCDPEMVLVEDVPVGPSDASINVRAGSLIRMARCMGQPLQRQDLAKLKPPIRFRVGQKRTEPPQTMGLPQFQKALVRAGIHWLDVEQEQELLQTIRNVSEDDRSRYGDTAWEMNLADKFVIDTDGLFCKRWPRCAASPYPRRHKGYSEAAGRA